MSDTPAARKPDAARVIYGSPLNGRDAGDEFEFNLGHWEVMEISLALQARARFHLEQVATWTEMRGYLSQSDPGFAENEAKIEHHTQAAHHVDQIDRRMFQHATTVTITRFDAAN